MGLYLYPHNQTAYEKALRLMEKEGKAAVIHPTGTGKSFIAFKLAEERPKARICWLSPSEHIVKTQLENLRKSAESDRKRQSISETGFRNITFLTYTKLMLMKQEAFEKLNPDYIILDEFHRCGAAEWGKSVEKLLAQYQTAKVLGLSATNIRYLDGQRDMADELFDGKIASEMTLGDAIVDGILPAPQYIISLYSCKEDLSNLKNRVDAISNKAIRAENEEIFEQLKRTLQNADGLDRIFARHMKKRNGRYLVFCMDKEHMEEMAAKAHDWFWRIDDEPHCYVVYYGNPEADREFTAFKDDKSDHLKLLYCIDMLNEGVHVEGIDGVILLRPTVSPILYLQQIGRCLAAGKKSAPIIFDIVNNFDSLYSIDSIEDEIQEALLKRDVSLSERKRFSERFRNTDESRDCLKLFEKLKRSLSSAWEIYYRAAEDFYRKNGNLNMPKTYMTESGLALGAWIITQRRVYAGKIPGRLTGEQIKKLNAIGMEWESKSEQRFIQGCEALAAYKNEHGNTDVKADYVTEEGFRLGKWVSAMRQKKKFEQRKAGDETAFAEDWMEKLDALGMIWDRHDWKWEQNFQAAEKYYKEHGNLSVPRDCVTEDGMRLGVWLENQRERYAKGKEDAVPLGTERISRLNAIGMEWEKKNDSIWDKYYALARLFYEENGHLNVPAGYCADGLELGKWIYSLRRKRQNPSSSGRKLTEDRIQKLDAIGMDWNRDAWEVKYRLAEDYYREHGNLKIPSDFVTKERIWLGKWVYEQKKSCKNRTLCEERKKKLEKIGIEWTNTGERNE